jgi:Spy/CpxP family protein refolding chaperone
MTNRMIFTVMLAGMVFAASAFAHDPGKDRGRQNEHGRANPVAEALERFGKSIRQLDLSEDQRAAIREEFSGIRESVKPLVMQLHENRKAIRESVMGEDFDADAVAEIAGKQGALTTDITMIVSASIANALSHLTDEQRAELMVLGEDRRAHRMEHREIIKQHKMERRAVRSQGGSEST